MKITAIRIDGRKPMTTELNTIVEACLKALAKAGYITEGDVLNGTALKIGQHMRSFSVDTTVHDRNLQCSPYGEKLTNLPTWDQRVKFNDILNAVLDRYGVTANIKSGPYTIRCRKQGAMTESDWNDQTPEWIRHNTARGYYIESINEKQYLEERRLKRNAAARARRIEMKRSEFKVVV